MFSDPFRPQSVAALQASPKEVPKRPKSPPKSSEEWILAQEEQNQTGLGNVRKQRDQEGTLLTAAQAWPKRAPEGERLLGDAERKDKANMIFGSLESIKDDIQRHARTWTKLLIQFCLCTYQCKAPLPPTRGRVGICHREVAKDAPLGPKFLDNPPLTPYYSPGVYPGKAANNVKLPL